MSIITIVAYSGGLSDATRYTVPRDFPAQCATMREAVVAAEQKYGIDVTLAFRAMVDGVHQKVTVSSRGVTMPAALKPWGEVRPIWPAYRFS
jgi:hypothetical protein